MDFKAELNERVDRIEAELVNYTKKEDCPEARLHEAMKYSLLAGGKRLRPVLLLATYELFDRKDNICIPFAVAMEMVHNFSLIHDDLPGIDNDDIRHGKPTNHKQFNEATAILAGDALLNQAYCVIISDIQKEKDAEILGRKLRAFQEFSEAISHMIAGEYVDTEYEGKKISQEYLEYMHKNKTGALLKNSVRMGAILADAKEDDIESLSLYAESIGLAFQIKDDILSEIGNEKELGKPVGNDRERGKCTYVTKYGLKEANVMLSHEIETALQTIEKFGDKAEFLRELTLYIQNRGK